MWITTFSIIKAKIWIKPADLKELNYALLDFSIKGNDAHKNIKYAENICVSRCVRIEMKIIILLKFYYLQKSIILKNIIDASFPIKIKFY